MTVLIDRHTSRTFVIILFLLGQSLLFGHGAVAQTLQDTASLAKKLQMPTPVDSLFVQRYLQQEPEFRQHLALVQQFYNDRQYQFAWIRNNQLVPQADKLVQAIAHARQEGLNPGEYKVKNLKQMFREYEGMSNQDPRKHQMKQEMDVALTASYFNYASDFYKGAVNPHSAAGIEWEVRKNKIKLNKALEAILLERESTYPFYEFEAIHPGYQKLRQALVQYRQLKEQGGWPQVEPQGVVQWQDTAAVVLDVRRRLLPQQPVRESDSALYVFDLEVEAAVKAFQKRHGLTVDGIVGPQTYQAMNVPVEDRIDQIVLNMERWRWLPKDLAQNQPHGRYVMVNIPAFRVTVMENGQKALQMKAVVGKTMHATPVFSHQMQYLIFSPYWNVPNSIVENEIRPHLIRDPSWLQRRNMEMVTTFGPGARRVPVSYVNWRTMNRHNFDYRIRQRPGPNNALGRVKFMFPNEYAVYLHDTPADHLFSEAERDFSHGCVRVERPADLATYLLQDVPGWDRSRVLQAMNSGEEQRVDLPQNVPVYLVYFTAWVEDDGTVNFREDLYGHDKALAQQYF